MTTVVLKPKTVPAMCSFLLAAILSPRIGSDAMRTVLAIAEEKGVLHLDLSLNHVDRVSAGREWRPARILEMSSETHRCFQFLTYLVRNACTRATCWLAHSNMTPVHMQHTSSEPASSFWHPIKNCFATTLCKRTTYAFATHVPSSFRQSPIS